MKSKTPKIKGRFFYNITIFGT